MLKRFILYSCFNLMVLVLVVACSSSDSSSVSEGLLIPDFEIQIQDSNRTVSTRSIDGLCIVIVDSGRPDMDRAFFNLIDEFESIVGLDVGTKLYVTEKDAGIPVLPTFRIVSDTEVFSMFNEHFRNQHLILFEDDALVYSLSRVPHDKGTIMKVLGKASGLLGSHELSPYMPDPESVFSGMKLCDIYSSDTQMDSIQTVVIADTLGHLRDSRYGLLPALKEQLDTRRALIVLTDRYTNNDTEVLNHSVPGNFIVVHIDETSSDFRSRFLEIKSGNLYQSINLLLSLSAGRIKQVDILHSLEDLRLML